MIEGDIDLTENLDFYKDRKEKKYKNSNAFLSDKSDDSTSRNLRQNWSWTSTSNTYNNSYIYRYQNPVDGSSNIIELDGIYETIDNSVGFGSNNWNWYDLTSSTISMNNPFITDISNNTISLRYNCNDNSITAKSFSFSWPSDVYQHKPSKSEKVFGKKKNKDNYQQISYVAKRMLGNKKKKIYVNTNAIKGKSYEKDKRRWMPIHSWYYMQSLNYRRIFGIKKSKEYEKGIPWLEDFKDRAGYRMYDDYMTELRENDKDYSSYLTNYSWLRMT